MRPSLALLLLLCGTGCPAPALENFSAGDPSDSPERLETTATVLTRGIQ